MHIDSRNDKIEGSTMCKINSKIFLTLIFVFLFISCSKDKNPIGYGDSLSNGIDFAGKIRFDFGSHAILKPDGTLWTWGNNWNSELVHVTKESINIPTQIKSFGKIIDFDLSGGMSLAADVNGNVWFWGSNMYSSYIWPEILTPTKISFLNGINKVEIFGLHGHFLRSDGSVWRIEIDSKANNYFYKPKVIVGMADIISISKSLALKKDGTLVELMASKDPEWGGFVAVQDVIAVQNSISHTVILKRDGSVWAW